MTLSTSAAFRAAKTSSGLLPDARTRAISVRRSFNPRRLFALRRADPLSFLVPTGNLTLHRLPLKSIGMPSQATATLSLQYTPPSAPTNSGNAVFSLSASFNAQNVGQIDVNPSDTAPTTFPIPFGSVSKAKILVIKNLGTTDIGVRLNGSPSDNFQISAQGELAYVCQTAPATTPITSASIVTTASPPAVETIQYWVFGD